VTEGTRRRHARRRSGELWDVISMGLVLDESTPGGPGADRYRPPAPLAVPRGGLIADGAGGLLLRPWRTADLIALRAAVDDAEIHRWLDAIPHPYTEADASEFLSMNRRTLAEGLGVGLAVTRQGTVVGSIGLRREGGEPGVGEVGYWVAAGARGQGVATAATRALAEWALGPAGLHRLELYAAVDNAPSRRVAERAGFELEGIRRAWRVVHHEPTDFAAYARLSPSTSPRTT
jgi:RimJ/RimL family protein N-acetyltransferase